MACCMFALVMVYQLIEAWQKTRRLLGLPARAFAAARERWCSPRTPTHRLAVIAALLAFDLGLGGGVAYAHRDHLAGAADSARSLYQTLCQRPVDGAAGSPNALALKEG